MRLLFTSLLAATPAFALWTPTQSTTWEIILIKTFDAVGFDNLPAVTAIDSDLEDNTAATWSEVKRRGYKTICYFSAGSWENFRDDNDGAHSRDLAIGLKNSVSIVDDVLDAVEFQVNEQCQEFNEPSEDYYEYQELQPFIEDNKAVFRIEYEATRPSTSRTNEICNWPYAAGFSTVIKTLDLNETTWRNCNL